MVRPAVRQAHGPDQVEGLTILSIVDGQMTITEIQNSKQDR